MIKVLQAERREARVAGRWKGEREDACRDARAEEGWKGQAGSGGGRESGNL